MARVGEEKLPIGSGKQLWEQNSLFKLFFPDPDFQEFSDVEWINAKVTAHVVGNTFHGPAVLEGLLRTEVYTQNGRLLPESEQETPTTFRVKVNFENNQLNGTVVIEQYSNSQLEDLIQILYKNNKVCVLFHMGKSDFIIKFNSCVEQYMELFEGETGFHWNESYPELLPENTNWVRKLDAAATIATHYRIL